MRLAVAVLVLLALAAPSLAGCLSGGKEGKPVEPLLPSTGAVALDAESVVEGLARLIELRREALTMEVNVTIHVVFVGLDAGLVDTDAVASALPKDYSPDVDFTAVREEGFRSGLRHHVSYEFHEASAAFADGLFAYYPSVAREVDIPKGTQGSPGFLEQYDAQYQLGRAASGTMWLVDAQKVEEWIAANRTAHGLAFAEPEHTIFFLDPWTAHKPFGESYHWYEYRNDTRAGAQTRDLRVWGGTTDLFYMDLAAAPNNEGNDASGLTKVDVCCGVSQPVTAPEGTAWNDPPIWHYEGDTATVGRGPYEHDVVLSDRIAHAVDVAVNLRMLGTYANRPVYKETYFVNVHLWHDGRSIIPKDDLPSIVPYDRLFEGLKREIPWANVTGEIKTYVAPDDDPGMDLALNRAKAEGVGAYIPIQPIYQYVDANSAKYRQNDPNVFDVMALLFIVEGDYTFFLPHIVGGVAFSGPDGTAWGTISSVNDYRYVNAGMDMGYVSTALISINAHEIGHFFGLTHAHDGSRRTADGYQSYLDHTWSSTATVMSYRMRPLSSDVFHVDILARGHTLENLEQTLRNAESVYRALTAAGVAAAPRSISDELTAATESYNTARRLFEDGSYVDAVTAAIEARRASERALAATDVAEQEVVVASWSREAINSVGYKHSAAFFRPAVVPTGVLLDLVPVTLDRDAERITVRASWTNSPASWCDCFVAWSYDPSEPLVAGPIPYGSPVSLGGAIHDDADELPTDGALVREFTLDLDMFASLRENVTIWVGAGTQGTAVNGAYQVEVVIAYRDHGDGKAPEPASGAPTLVRVPRERVVVPDLAPSIAAGFVHAA